MWFLRFFSMLIMLVYVASQIDRPLPPYIQIDDETCLKVQQASVRNAFNKMLDIAQSAYDRSTMARSGQSAPSDAEVVTKTFNTYFSLDWAPGSRGRLTSVIGNAFLCGHVLCN